MCLGEKAAMCKSGSQAATRLAQLQAKYTMEGQKHCSNVCKYMQKYTVYTRLNFKTISTQNVIL